MLCDHDAAAAIAAYSRIAVHGFCATKDKLLDLFWEIFEFAAFIEMICPNLPRLKDFWP